MAIITATAKLYQGIRCYVVDKNISAALTATFSTGHTRRNEDGGIVYDDDGIKVIDPNILGLKIVRTIADLLCPRPRPVVVDERYLTYGGSNLEGVINPAQPWIETASLRCDNQVTFFRLDFATLGIPEGQDCVVMLEEGFVYETKGRKTANGQSNIYPLALEGAPSARNDLFASFRTPKTLSFTQTQITASLYNLYGRIRPFAAELTNALGFVVRGTYAPTDRIQMIGTSFFVLPVPVKTVRPTIPLSVVSTIIPNNRRVRISDPIPLENEVTAELTGSIRYRQGLAEMPLASFIVSSGERELGVITAAISSQAIVECDIGKIQGIVETTPVVASLSVLPTKTTRIQQSLVMSANVISDGSVPMVLNTKTWQNNQVFVLPIFYGNINAQIDWGDGVSETVTQTYGATWGVFPSQSNVQAIKHTYATPGDYKVTISGYVQHWGFATKANMDTLTAGNNVTYIYLLHLYDVQSFGYIGIESLVGVYRDHMLYRFYRNNPGLQGPPSVPTRLPETCKDTSWMFFQTSSDAGSTAPGGNALWIDNQIANWNTSNVENMEGMFYRCRGGFDTNLGSWNVAKVRNFSNMFRLASSFSGTGMGSWNTESATNMSFMFYQSGFQEDLPYWDVSSVTDFRGMFAYISFGDNGPFHGRLSNWDLSSAPNREALELMLWGTGYTLGNTTFNYYNDLTWWCVPNISSTPPNFIGGYSGTAQQPYWGRCPGKRPEVISVVPDKTIAYEGEMVTFTVTFVPSPNITTFPGDDVVNGVSWLINTGYTNNWDYWNSGNAYFAQDGTPNSASDINQGPNGEQLGQGGFLTYVSPNTFQLTIRISTDYIDPPITEGDEYFRIDILSRGNSAQPISLFDYLLASSPVITIKDGSRP